MYLLDDQLILSASDLNNYVQCRHLTSLDLAYARGEIADKATDRDPIAALLSEKGEAHEQAYLQKLQGEGREVVEIEMQRELGRREALVDAAGRTIEAMHAGGEVIYQATFFENGLRGHADFLFRVDVPSELGDWSYEVGDAKLARRTKPYYVFQLCFYSEFVEGIQGVAPKNIRVILGTGEEHSYRLAEFSAYFRRVRRRFLADLDVGIPDTYPDPVDHCSICDWREVCDARRVDDDHLSLVANIGRVHVERLNGDGVSTLAELAQLLPGRSVPRIRDEILAKHREQAALQLAYRETGELQLRHLSPEAGRGFYRLPPPSDGDVFFDMESDPFFEDGLEYLCGMVTVDTGEPHFEIFWGTDRTMEKAAFERFIDFVVERRERWPDLHIYHYAAYEVTALKRLAGMHATREAELDSLLREHVFVDLYKVVREGLRISQPSYSLKKVEAFYMDERETSVTDGNDSVIEFERWLDTEPRDQSILDAIGEYNRDDCLSTWRLRDWLLAERTKAVAAHGVEIEWTVPEPTQRSQTAIEVAEENATLARALLADIPADAEEMDDEERLRLLTVHLLEYHNREDRPVWWIFFDRLDRSADALFDDLECLAGLEPDASIPPRQVAKSLAHRMRFPVQETKVDAGDDLRDHTTGRGAGEILEIDRPAGWLDLKRGPGLKDIPLPHALMPGGPYDTPRQEEAMRRVARAVSDHGFSDPGPYRAARDLLRRVLPRIAGHGSGTPLQEGSISIEEMREIVVHLEDSYLFIQGPPGSGKTWKGARLVTDLVRHGKRVGVAANSHKAIHNLLEAIEKAATEERLEFRGIKKASTGNDESYFESKLDEPLITNATSNVALTADEVQLAAGTAWLHCDEVMDRTLDYLFIDEAGQISLADVLAMATAARNVVLLGDPQQLPQVTQARHPDGAGVSVLEHLLGDRQTIPPEEGLFLDRSFRMHPDVSTFVSEIMYEERLRSAEHCGQQRLDDAGEMSGTGLRWFPVQHEANAQESPEEAHRVAELISSLRGATWTNGEGKTAQVTDDDVLVVTPYNAQVRCLREKLPSGVRIGTVDKFQGQEAAAVIFSMATSSGAEVPRNLEFLFSRNRLNVAISRARCVAAIVASPRLLEINCTTIDQMRLVNAICRAVEVSGGSLLTPKPARSGH
jgi:predicted RecB family nuclease